MTEALPPCYVFALQLPLPAGRGEHCIRVTCYYGMEYEARGPPRQFARWTPFGRGVPRWRWRAACSSPQFRISQNAVTGGGERHLAKAN